jgi:hypothetical protein
VQGDDRILQSVHALTARLIVNKFLPLAIASADEFTEVIQAATHLKPGTYTRLTRQKLNACLVSMFATFASTVTTMIVAARALHMPNGVDDELGCPLPGWLTVCHDGWDSTIKQFFGVSVYWIDPHTFNRYKLALGLAVPNGHRADECEEAAMEVLGRYGITKNDIFATVNDTTNASVATGRLLAGENGDCTMHVANLVCDHAMGKRTRSKNKQIVDSFPECESVREKVIKSIKYIFCKRAKSRSDAYKKRNELFGMHTIRIGLPNDTRISGTELMYQNLLRSMYTMQLYYAKESAEKQTNYSLTQQEWSLVAGFEAVTRPICALSFSAQIDSRPSASQSWLNIIKCKVETAKKTFKVVDVEFADDDNKKWDAKVPFKSLPMKKFAVTEMPAPVGQLQTRMLKELEQYFPKPSDHQCLAMALDPVMLTTGLPLLLLLGQADLYERCMDLLKKAIEEEVARTHLPSGYVEPEPEQNDNGFDEDENPIEMALRTLKETIPPRLEKSYYDIAEEAFKSWKELKVDWLSFMKDTQKIVLTEEEKKSVSYNDCYFLVEKVDILKWWSLHEQMQHSLVKRIAARELAIPDANSLQERMFSFCKLVDGPRRQNLGNEKFEMLCLLAFNRDFINECKGLSLDTVVASLDSAASPSAAVKVLSEFFELDIEWEEAELGDVPSMAQLLKDAVSFENKQCVKNNKRKRV